MEVKLENLIEKIKKEGIEDGRSAGEEIIADARVQATAIIEKARTEAAALVEEAKKKTDQFQVNAERAVKQAARDGEMILKERIVELFDRVFKQKIGEALAPELVKELVTRIITQWKPGAGVELVVAPDDEKKLTALLVAGLRDELKKTVTIRSSAAVGKGFRIGVKGEDVYYDFTDESIAELLRAYINPGLKELLDK